MEMCKKCETDLDPEDVDQAIQNVNLNEAIENVIDILHSNVSIPVGYLEMQPLKGFDLKKIETLERDNLEQAEPDEHVYVPMYLDQDLESNEHIYAVIDQECFVNILYCIGIRK